MKDAADLIRAVADLLSSILWPLVALFVVVLLRHEIPGFMGRIRELIVNLGGDKSVQVSLDKKLDRLSETKDELAATADAIPAELAPRGRNIVVHPPKATARFEALPPSPRVTVGELRKMVDAIDPTAAAEAFDRSGARDAFDPIEAIEAGTDRRLILIGLGAEIERRARQVLATIGDPTWQETSLGRLLGRLELPANLKEVVGEFRDIRNRIVHGRGASDAEVARAVDLGIQILGAIDRIPLQTHVVYKPTVEIFRDQEGREPHEEGHGVILESTGSDGAKEFRVFPTTRTAIERLLSGACHGAISGQWTKAPRLERGLDPFCQLDSPASSRQLLKRAEAPIDCPHKRVVSAAAFSSRAFPHY